MKDARRFPKLLSQLASNPIISEFSIFMHERSITNYYCDVFLITV